MTLQEAAWIGSLLFDGVFIFGFAVAAAQLCQLKKNRRFDNCTAIISKVAEHNWHVVDDELRKYVVEIFEGLSPSPPDPNDITENKLYWATRSVHLSHLLLLAHVWALNGERDKLEGDLANWQRFAHLTALHLSGKIPTQRPSAYVRACSELWSGLDVYEPLAPGFATWLKRLSNTTMLAK